MPNITSKDIASGVWGPAAARVLRDSMRRDKAVSAQLPPTWGKVGGVPFDDHGALEAITKKPRKPRGPRKPPNRWEAEWGQLLDIRRMAGEIRSFAFEAITLRLAGGEQAAYTPDWFVVMADGTMEFHEVKGFFRDDARVKYKIAKGNFPMFKFRVVRKRKSKDGGGWEEIS